MKVRDKICMSRKEFDAEHRELSRILRKGTVRERLHEASKQDKELTERKSSTKSKP